MTTAEIALERSFAHTQAEMEVVARTAVLDYIEDLSRRAQKLAATKLARAQIDALIAEAAL